MLIESCHHIYLKSDRTQQRCSLIQTSCHLCCIYSPMLMYIQYIELLYTIQTFRDPGAYKKSETKAIGNSPMTSSSFGLWWWLALWRAKPRMAYRLPGKLVIASVFWLSIMGNVFLLLQNRKLLGPQSATCVQLDSICCLRITIILTINITFEDSHAFLFLIFIQDFDTFILWIF